MAFSDFTNTLQKLKKRRFVWYGLPFLIFVVGAPFALQELTSYRYKFRKSQFIPKEVADSMGIKIKKPGEVTLETEYEKIQKLNIDTYENKRGPRPWEESDKSASEIAT